MGLRVKKHFYMGQAIRMHTFNICPGKIEEIFLLQKNRHSKKIQIEKILKAIKLVCFAHILNCLIRQTNPVSFGQVQHHFRFKSPLYVQMQFCFWEVINQSLSDIRHISVLISDLHEFKLDRFPPAGQLAPHI